ncbi:hypothetical protein DRO69_02320 [Candidatus Bathyarchaeota archaeon]|nr:MAG: hypothetical protein DRO69_02320 [Candidatus Bathyarchaeota archaeon]
MLRRKKIENIREKISTEINKILKMAPQKLKDNVIIAWLLTKNTLTVVVMAAIILTPIIIYPFLIGWPAPYCYVAYALWLSLIFGSIVVAAIIGYLKETQVER